MRKAFDTFLLSEVPADLAAKDCSFEPYRYECANCGEEVRLAAVGSISMVPHFRHRNGNSDKECEYYLGHYGVLSSDNRSRKSKSERAEFYFNINTKLFYLGLRFSENEIIAYEQHSTTFEMRVLSQAQPFISILINNKSFSPDVQRLIPLSKFSHSYFLSNTMNGMKRKYEVFKDIKGNVATFFKLQEGDAGYRAKLVRGSVLYTNTPYFIAIPCQSQHWTSLDISLPDGINVECTFNFETMERKFLGKCITITSKTQDIDSLLLSWGYKLEAGETLTLLWPPAVLSEDVSMIEGKEAYIYTTFELHPHGNINIQDKDIVKISDLITKVSVESKIKIFKKNTEIMLESYKRESDSYIELTVEHKTKRVYQVEDDFSFMFNSSGVFRLGKGMVAQMTQYSRVMHYSNGYLDGLIEPFISATISEEQLLQDALIYYKRTEPFCWDDFESIDLSQTAFHYIEECEKLGKINSAAKLLITEGRI